MAVTFWHCHPIQIISILGNKEENGLLGPADGAALNQILHTF